MPSSKFEAVTGSSLNRFVDAVVSVPSTSAATVGLLVEVAVLVIPPVDDIVWATTGATFFGAAITSYGLIMSCSSCDRMWQW